MHYYSAYGLTIASDIVLPALAPAPVGPADISIAAADIPDSFGGNIRFRNWEASPSRFLSHFHDTGRVLVEEGSRISYDRFAACDDSQIVSIILGTSLAAALMQRGILPMHACSVLTDHGAVLVMGASGAGKSTTLGGLLELGLPMMADDVTAITAADDGTVVAIPAFPAIRLWEDSLTALGRTSEGLQQVRSDMNKHYLPIERFHAKTEPVHAVFQLVPDNGANLRIVPIEPAFQVATLSKFIFRKNFIDGMELRKPAFERIAQMANQVRLFEVRRPPIAIPPSAVAQAMLDCLRESDCPAAIDKATAP